MEFVSIDHAPDMMTKTLAIPEDRWGWNARDSSVADKWGADQLQEPLAL